MKKLLIALMAGVFGVMVSGCDKKGPELAGILDVTAVNVSTMARLVDYPVFLTKNIEKVPYVELKRGVTDKNGMCRFEFASGELKEYNEIEGNYLKAFAVILNPVDQKPVGYMEFTLYQGATLPLTVYGKLNQ